MRLNFGLNRDLRCLTTSYAYGLGLEKEVRPTHLFKFLTIAARGGPGGPLSVLLLSLNLERTWMR
jgi:hypothetical protein